MRGWLQAPVVLAVLAVVFLGCTIGEIDYARYRHLSCEGGAACPSGYVCRDDRCRAEGEGGTEGEGEGDDAAADAGGGEAGGVCVPATEVCNGRDDDCDGREDEDLEELTCGKGACLRTVPACEQGVPQDCRPGSPIPELCNGADDDCDDDVDETEDGDPLTRSCYTGPAGTEGVGECRAGARTCEGGTYPEGACPGDVTPVAETADDDGDEDCDGLTDEGFASLFFTGQRDSRVTLSEDRALSLSTVSFTIEAWIRPESLTYYRANVIVARRSDGTGDGWLLGVSGLGDFEDQGLQKRGLVFLVGSWPADGDGELLASPAGAASVADDVWQHVAVVFGYEQGVSGNHHVALFLDGRLVAVASEFSRDLPVLARIPPAWIGADPADMPHSFHGRIADVRITGGVAYDLSDGCALGQRCFEPQACLPECEDAVGHWPLHEGEEDVAHDVSGHGRHGTVTGVVTGAGSRWRAGETCQERILGGGEGEGEGEGEGG